MDKKVGELIKVKRLELGMTQKQLASKLYVTDKAISKWERGICYPDAELLQSLSEALIIPIEDLTAARYSNMVFKKDVKKIYLHIVLVSAIYIVLGIICYLLFFSNPITLITTKRFYIFIAIIIYNALFFSILLLLIRRNVSWKKFQVKFSK